MNRFQDPTLRRQYDACVRCYITRHKDLIRADGARHRGNSATTAFWRGYDGHTKPAWDAASKSTPAYACYRAGQDIAARVAAGDLPAVTDEISSFYRS